MSVEEAANTATSTTQYTSRYNLAAVTSEYYSTPMRPFLLFRNMTLARLLGSSLVLRARSPWHCTSRGANGSERRLSLQPSPNQSGGHFHFIAHEPLSLANISRHKLRLGSRDSKGGE